jgi:N-acetylneuraminic acid mutarotase
MRRLIFTLAILAAGESAAFAQDWSAIAPLSTSRFGATGAAIGDDFYVLGGSGVSDLSSASRWSAASGSWTAVSSMSITRQHAGAASLGGRLYAIGGYGPGGMATANAERFDPATGAWSAIAALPEVRALAGVVAHNGAIYVISGEDATGMPQESTFRYDPATNQWTALVPVMTPRSGGAAAMLNGEIYLMGGAFGSSLDVTEIYDPASGGWRVGPSLPEPLWMPAAASFDGRIWVMGGFDAGFQRSDRVYSLGTDGTWRTEPALPLAVAGAACASNGTRLLVAGGMDANGNAVTSAVTRVGELPPPPPPPPPADDDTLFCSVQLTPHTLNLRSNGHWLTAEIRSETGDVGLIDAASLTLAGVAIDMGVAPTLEDGVLCVKFPRSGFGHLTDGEQMLALAGLTTEGDVVAGEGQIRIAGANQKKPSNERGPAVKPGRGNNPFAAMEFSLETPMQVEMDVLDVQGRQIGVVASGFYGAGTHAISWNAAGSLSSGVYFVRARFGWDVQTTRFAVIR